MMGIDMFHEERLVLTNKIEFLDYRLNSLEEKLNQEEKTNKRLSKEKIEMIHKYRKSENDVKTLE